MNKVYRVTLTTDERQVLRALVHKGTAAARKLTHARILLKADHGRGGPAWTDATIAQAVEVSPTTVSRVRKQCVEEGVTAALGRRPQPPRPRKLDGRQEAQLIALSCSAPPEGREGWSFRLLADRMVALEYVDVLSYETVRRVLKKTNSSRG